MVESALEAKSYMVESKIGSRLRRYYFSSYSEAYEQLKKDRRLLSFKCGGISEVDDDGTD